MATMEHTATMDSTGKYQRMAKEGTILQRHFFTFDCVNTTFSFPFRNYGYGQYGNYGYGQYGNYGYGQYGNYGYGYVHCCYCCGYLRLLLVTFGFQSQHSTHCHFDFFVFLLLLLLSVRNYGYGNYYGQYGNYYGQYGNYYGQYGNYYGQYGNYGNAAAVTEPETPQESFGGLLVLRRGDAGRNLRNLRLRRREQ
jgi:hypothetical protein